MKFQIVLMLLACVASGQVRVTTYVGSTFSGHIDGFGRQTKFNRPYYISAFETNLYIWEDNQVFRRITPDLKVSTMAWTNFGTSLGGRFIAESDSLVVVAYGVRRLSFNGQQALLDNGAPISLTKFLNEYWVSDPNTIFRLDLINGTRSPLLGGSSGTRDGCGLFCELDSVRHIRRGAAGAWLVDRNSLRFIDTNYCITTIIRGSAQDDGWTGIAIDKNNRLWAFDGRRLFVYDGRNLQLVAGASQWGYRDEVGTNALFYSAGEIAFGHDEALYIADTFNHCIRRVEIDVETQTVALAVSFYPAVTLTGNLGERWVIESSADMQNWSARAEIQLTAQRVLWFDTIPLVKHFYRAVKLD